MSGVNDLERTAFKMLSPPWSTLTEKILPCQEGVRLPRQVAPGDVCVLIFQAGGCHGYHDEWWEN